jgi:hypothetical protein
VLALLRRVAAVLRVVPLRVEALLRPDGRLLLVAIGLGSSR